MYLKRLALSSALTLATFSSFAQTVTVSSATVAAGNPATITVSFSSTATAPQVQTPTASIQIDLTIARPPVVASGFVTGATGTVTAGATPTCGGNASTNLTGTNIRTIVASAASPPTAIGTAASQVVCTFTIPTSTTAAVGTFPFALALTEFTNTAGVKFTGTTVNGSITITPPVVGGSAVTQSPATLAFGASNVGTPTVTSNLVLANTNATAGSATCTIGGVNAGDFAFFPAVAGGVVAIASGATVNVPVRFTPSGAGARGGSIACVGTTAATVITGSPTALTGTGVPVDTAPVIAYAPAPAAAVNFPAGLAGAATTTIAISTTTPGVGTGNTVVSACAITGAPGFVPAGTVSTTPVNGTFNVATTTGSINLGCTRGAAVQTATLTCTETRTPTVVGSPFTRTWPLTCPAATAPAPVVAPSLASGSPIALATVINAASVSAPAVVFTNSVVGSTPGLVTCTIAAPANGWSVAPAGAQSVANGTPVPFTFSFGAVALGAQNAVATCSGTGLAAPVTFNLNGTGNPLPVLNLVTQVPTLSTLSIWLLVASMLGFGLVMVGRRQA